VFTHPVPRHCEYCSPFGFLFDPWDSAVFQVAAGTVSLFESTGTSCRLKVPPSPSDDGRGVTFSARLFVGLPIGPFPLSAVLVRFFCAVPLTGPVVIGRRSNLSTGTRSCRSLCLGSFFQNFPLSRAHVIVVNAQSIILCSCGKLQSPFSILSVWL